MRFYDPQTGRFTQQDPTGSGLNWYVYVAGNPFLYVDPYGAWAANIGYTSGDGGTIGFNPTPVAGGTMGGIGTGHLKMGPSFGLGNWKYNVMAQIRNLLEVECTIAYKDPFAKKGPSAGWGVNGNITVGNGGAKWNYYYGGNGGKAGIGGNNLILAPVLGPPNWMPGPLPGQPDPLTIFAN